MKRLCGYGMTVVLAIALAVPATFAADDMAKKLNDVLMQAPSQKYWQIKAEDVAAMMKEKKTDFVIVDVRPNPQEYQESHIPGSIYIAPQEILKPENLKKLPKDKKAILVCVTGQVQNLPIVPLRALGYNAYTMSFGYSAWTKDYRGGKNMQEAIQGAATKNYPVQK